ncbi:MAG: (2Fe-2S)-binding protein [Sulfolobales archaeon]
MRISFTVNGVKRAIDVKPSERLIDVLRNRLGIKSVRAGCLVGDCGICTVIMDGKLVKSCTVLAVEANGSNIITLEGLSEGLKPSPVQRAFVESFGYQCGYCTPAFVLTAYWISENMVNASDKEISEVLNSIVCRCTGYKQILDSVRLALRWKRGGEHG